MLTAATPGWPGPQGLRQERRSVPAWCVCRPYADWIARPAEEVVGRPIVEVLGAEAFADLLPKFRRVLSGEPVRYERAVNFRGIGPRWIIAIYTPTRSPSGEVDGWVAVVLDITDRKAAEEALRRREQEFRALAENTLDLIA